MHIFWKVSKELAWPKSTHKKISIIKDKLPSKEVLLAATMCIHELEKGMLKQNKTKQNDTKKLHNFYSFNKYLLSSYHRPGPILGTKNKAVKQVR